MGPEIDFYFFLMTFGLLCLAIIANELSKIRRILERQEKRGASSTPSQKPAQELPKL